MTRIWKGEKLSFWFHTSHSIRNKSHSSQFQTLRLMKGSCEKIRNQFCAALFPLMIALFYVDNFEAIFLKTFHQTQELRLGGV